jgi:cysteine-rich repeat protein
MTESAGWTIDDVTIGPPGCYHAALGTCGDGVVDSGEECDDGNGSNEDECLDDCTFNTIEVLVIANHGADSVAADFASYISDVNFSWLHVASYVPVASDFDGYHAVLLFENGVFANSTAVGNAVATYHESGGGVVLGTFYWQENPFFGGDWGNFHNYEAMTYATNGCEYNADSMDNSSIVAHPVTAGVTALYAASYRGGTEVVTEATGLAFWTTLNQASTPDPVVAVRTTAYGRTAGVSVFPDYASYGSYGSSYTGDFYLLFENALRWVR